MDPKRCGADTAPRCCEGKHDAHVDASPAKCDRGHRAGAFAVSSTVTRRHGGLESWLLIVSIILLALGGVLSLTDRRLRFGVEPR